MTGFEAAAVVAGLLQGLGGMFSGRRASREAEANRALTKEELEFRKRQYKNEQEARRRLGLRAQDYLKKIDSGEMFGYRDTQEAPKNYMDYSQNMFTGQRPTSRGGGMTG